MPDSAPNPYTPGAGDRPRALVGRNDQLALANSVRTQIETGYTANSLVYIGLRGVGKTALLKEVAERLTAAGWFAPYTELRRNVPVGGDFAQAAESISTLLKPGKRLRRRVTELLRRGGSLQVMASGGSLNPGQQQTGYHDLRSVLEDLLQTASDDGTGVALVVDELQSLTKTNLSGLVHLVQDLRDRYPFAFIGAGLPHLPAEIAKAATYAERFRYEPTDNLGEREAQAAILEPARAEGATWRDDALGRLVSLADGYPYFLQLYAYESWEVASRRGPVRAITVDDVEAAVPIAQQQIETGIFGARFSRSTNTERRYLFAMQSLMTSSGSDRVRSGEVARVLGRELTALSPIRDNLIRKGMIHSPEHGYLSFSVPGFGEYLGSRRQDYEEI